MTADSFPQPVIPYRERKPREKGIAIIIATVMLMFTVGIVGLAIDGGVAYFVKGRLMAAVDAAALGAGRGLNLGDTLEEAQSEATTSATRFFAANFPNGFMGTDPARTVMTPRFEMIMRNGAPTGVLQVEVTGSVVAPTYFMKIFSKPNMTIAASGTATRRTLVMMLILDVSGSMSSRTSVGTIPTSVTSTSRSCDAMIYSASRFLKYFSPYDYVGIASFNSRTRVNYAPSTQFKSAGSSGADHVLANMNCSGGTNTAPALNLSWDEIRGVGLKLAANTMVLFTDGMPNQVTGNWPLRTEVDDRFGPGPTYGTNPPTNTSMLYRDSRDPFASTSCSNPSPCPKIPPDPSEPSYTDPNIPLNQRGYTASQRALIAAGVEPFFGDSRFLPLRSYQWDNNRSDNLRGYNDYSTNARNTWGFHLPNSTATSYVRRWIQDNDAPEFNFDYCRSSNTDVDVADRGVTWMCYKLPLPSTATTPSTMYGGFGQGESYDPRFGSRGGNLTAPVDGESAGALPSGFPNGTNRITSQTVAYIPEEDAMGNSNRGPRDNWIFNVNESCAPSGTVVPSGSGGLCKFRGGTWDGYPGVGVGSNFFTDGPYKDFLRPDVPNVYPAAAMNAAISAANRIRSDSEYNIRIDAIYLIGNEPNVDREFLQFIANVETIQPTVFDGGTIMPYANTNYNSAQQKGLWFSTSDPQALSTLFAQIASSLLRISR